MLDPCQNAANLVAEILHEVEVPSVLFGWQALRLVGDCPNIPEIDFVIPDKQLPAAINALTNAGFNPCTWPNCIELDIDRHTYCDCLDGETASNRFHPVAAAHFHLQNGEYLLSVHRQYNILWWLPEIPLELHPDHDHAYLWQTCDPRLPPYEGPYGPLGPWLPTPHPVQILSPDKFTEAILLLICRDCRHWRNLDHLWLCMLESLFDYEGLHFVLKKDLDGRFEEAWSGVNREINEQDYFPLMGLRMELKGRGELGVLPLNDADEVWELFC